MRTKQVSTDDCWLFAGTLNAAGYGRMECNLDGKTYRFPAHRVVYENFVGEVPEGLILDHLCEVKQCVNPDHLEPVTTRENLLRTHRAKTHCKRGHEYTLENIRWLHRTALKRPSNPTGEFRICNTCFEKRRKEDSAKYNEINRLKRIANKLSRKG